MLDIHLDFSSLASPLHLQLYEQIALQIEQSLLVTGERLPPTRALSQQLNISRGSVVRAYETLVSAGLCRSETGRGTFVTGWPEREGKPPVLSTRQSKNRLAEPAVGSVSLLPSQANVDHLPISDFRNAFNRTLRYPARFSQFGESAGDFRLRSLVCEHLLPARGIHATPEQVLIVPGTQYASVLLAMTLNKTHRRLHFGVPGYLDIARNFERFGFDLVPHAVDEEGMTLPESAGDSDVIYCMPEHHFPQCVALSAQRRQRLLSWAELNKLYILEDDYDSEFYFNRMPQLALKANDPQERVIYLGTFSKSLFNSLRLGYVVASEALINSLASLHWNLSRGTSSLLQRWVGELIEAGMYERHIRRMRSVYRVKRDAVAELINRHFPCAQFTLPSGGLQLLIECPDKRCSTAIFLWCKENGVRLADPANYVLDCHCGPDFIVLGFANIPLHDFEALLLKLKHFLSCMAVGV
ncbi:hypothetical protein BFW88_18015 [Pseudomonas fluorescens]|nr:hypothetical protein BFW88_18015 [Pseudomonas fluorescens]OPB07964.1 hypothetical protein BFW92_17955 [Pseudomonas fluorescens]OPB18739.1 hypothetical protein BFW93_17975 [Pseudomonas fluorescens]